MSFSDLSSIGSFVSGIAVVVSLVYLSLQIRQNTKHSRALIQQGRANRIADSSLRLAELIDTEGMERCFDGSPDVSSGDLRRFLYMCRSAFVSVEDSWLQHREGLLDGLAFASFETSVKAGAGSMGLVAAWKMSRQMYEPAFRDYMDSILCIAEGQGPMGPGRLEVWRKILSDMTGAAHDAASLPSSTGDTVPGQFSGI